MDDLTRLVQTMAREGLKRRNPGRTEEEIDALYSELVLGPELTAKVREHRRGRLARRQVADL